MGILLHGGFQAATVLAQGEVGRRGGLEEACALASGAEVELAELRLWRLEPPLFPLGVLLWWLIPAFASWWQSACWGCDEGAWSEVHKGRLYLCALVRRDLLGGSDVGPVLPMSVLRGGDMGDGTLVG